MSDSLADRIRRVPIFSALDDAGLADVAALGTEFEAPKGQVLVEYGQAGAGVFIIEDGEVRVDRPHGEHVDLGPGAFFGELSTLDGVPRTSSARACEATLLLRLEREELLALMEQDPALGIGLTQFLCSRVRALQDGAGSR